MFKIHENGDGTTSVFCNSTGRLICTIKSKQRNMGLGCRPVNVVEPSPKVRSCCYNMDLKGESSDEEKQKDKNDRCVSPVLNEPKEEFPIDSITSENFTRCLNLVPTVKFKHESVDDLKFTFPLRHLSKRKPLVNDIKFPEELPITSSMGLKVLNINKSKNFLCDQTVEMKIKNYDNFCRFQINYVFGHPNLRCREKKDYPVCFPSKIFRDASSHTYAFNKRQRMENMITIKTGLNTRSRKLLLKCNKRLAVSIKRLPDDEIKYWMQKRARFGPITADLIRGENSSLVGSNFNKTVIEQRCPTYVDIDLCSDESSESSDSDDPSYKCKMSKKLKFQKSLNCKNSLSPLRNRKGHFAKLLNNFEMYKDSSVVLDDVLHKLYRCNGEYYISGTNIKVPFLENYINSLNSKTRNKFVFPETKIVYNPRYAHDHAYHRPFYQEPSRKNLLSYSNCLNQKNSKTTDFRNKLKGNNCVKSQPLKHNSVKSSSSTKPPIIKTIPDLTVIPVIDLTSSPPCSPPKKGKGNSSYWIFHCYGCGFRDRSCREPDARSIALRHLKNFHCVSDPDSFLNICNTSSGVTLEAFPGYKKG